MSSHFDENIRDVNLQAQAEINFWRTLPPSPQGIIDLTIQTRLQPPRYRIMTQAVRASLPTAPGVREIRINRGLPEQRLTYIQHGVQGVEPPNSRDEEVNQLLTNAYNRIPYTPTHRFRMARPHIERYGPFHQEHQRNHQEDQLSRIHVRLCMGCLYTISPNEDFCEYCLNNE
jgi:hypothetical protein